MEGERDCYNINSPSLVQTVKDPLQISSFREFKEESRGDFITKLTFEGLVQDDELNLLEPFVKINRFADYFEGIIKGETKANAMGLILEKLNILREESIAIGDGVNDLDMIRFAGLGIAMGNACEELKAAAGAVTADCGNGGVAEALRKFAS